MEIITSRKNSVITHMRALANDRAYRREKNLYLCDGEKLLREAIASGTRIETLLFSGKAPGGLPENIRVYEAPSELLLYASPLENTRGPLFSAAMPEPAGCAPVRNAIILENVQNPGNVGTVIRTADALGIGAVILTGACADLYNPKTVRSAMGALFRQKVMELTLDGLFGLVESSSLPLLGASPADGAGDLRKTPVSRAAVAIGSEGKGLSGELSDRCAGRVIIPMSGKSESLNAAVAAAIIMWEMAKDR